MASRKGRSVRYVPCRLGRRVKPRLVQLRYAEVRQVSQGKASRGEVRFDGVGSVTARYGEVRQAGFGVVRLVEFGSCKVSLGELWCGRLGSKIQRKEKY